MNTPVIESKHIIIDGISQAYDHSNLSKHLDDISNKIGAHVLGEPLNFSLGNSHHSVRIYEESHGELVFIKDFFGEGKHYVGFNGFTCGNSANPNKICPRMNSYMKNAFGLVQYILPQEESPRKKKIALPRGMFSANPINKDTLHEKINDSNHYQLLIHEKNL